MAQQREAAWPLGRRVAGRPGGRAVLALAVAAVAAVLGVGLNALVGYVHDYVLYRGFGPPKPTVPPAERGTLVHLRIRSRALGGKVETAVVYLPPGYAATAPRRYPVVYLLHGTPGDPVTAYVNSLHIAPRMDALIAQGRVQPMILVMPPGSRGTYNAATEWANGPRPGDAWFTYLTRDVVRAVDRHYRVIRGAAGRGIGGLSSGADAAVNAALLRPGEYGVVEGWSGDYRQTPRTVDRVASLVERFSAVDTAAAHAAAVARAGTHIYLYTGRHDRVLPANRLVAGALRRRGVHVLLQVRPGGHAWMLWSHQLDAALRYFSDHLAGHRPRPVPAASGRNMVGSHGGRTGAGGSAA